MKGLGQRVFGTSVGRGRCGSFKICHCPLSVAAGV